MEHIEASELPDNDRYRYLLNHMIKQREVWLLKERDGFFAMFEDNQNQSYIPIWPDQKAAQEFTTEDWQGYLPDKMGLGEFLSWLDELKTDQIFIGAFPNTSMKSLAIDPLDFKKQILELQSSSQ